MQHPSNTRTALSRRNLIGGGVLATAAIALVDAQLALGQATTKGATM